MPQSEPRKLLPIPGKLAKDQMKELNNLFGPPPVLSSENTANYLEVRRRVNHVLRAQDFMELFLIRQLANEMWKIARYTRHQTAGIERQNSSKIGNFRRSAGECRQQAKKRKRRALGCCGGIRQT